MLSPAVMSGGGHHIHALTMPTRSHAAKVDKKEDLLNATTATTPPPNTPPTLHPLSLTHLQARWTRRSTC